MLQGLLNFLYCFSSIVLIGLVLAQKSKGGLGLGSLGGSSQMLFGGSGGQTLFQKITWILGVILMAGGLTLAIYKYKNFQANYLTGYRPAAHAPLNSGN